MKDVFDHAAQVSIFTLKYQGLIEGPIHQESQNDCTFRAGHCITSCVSEIVTLHSQLAECRLKHMFVMESNPHDSRSMLISAHL